MRMGFGVGLEWVTEYWGRLFWWKRKFLEGEVFDANNTLSYESKAYINVLLRSVERWTGTFVRERKPPDD